MIVVYFMILFVGINGGSLNIPTSINEIALLLEEFWSLKPAAFLSSKPFAICPFIDNCCQNKDRSEAIALMITTLNTGYRESENFPEIINKCTDPNKLIKRDQSCPSLKQFSSLPSVLDKKDADINQFYNLMKSYDGIRAVKLLVYMMQEYCNDDEAHAFLCLSDKKLLQSCVAKALQNMLDAMGDIGYSEIIKEIKQTLIRINQQLIQFSFKNTNTN